MAKIITLIITDGKSKLADSIKNMQKSKSIELQGEIYKATIM